MNPYLPPSGGSSPPAGGYGAPNEVGASGGGVGVTDMTVETMRQTKPWVMLMGVFSLIGSAFMALAGLLMMAMGAMMPKNGPVSPAVLGFVYIPMAALYVYPGIKLWKYGSSIGRLVASRSPPDLEEALGHQKSFWKFVGVLTLVIVVLYAVIFAGAMVAGIVGAASRH